MEFQFEATADGRPLDVLNVIDEYSRLCLGIRMGRRCKAKDVLVMLRSSLASTQLLRSSAVITPRVHCPCPTALVCEQRRHNRLIRVRLRVAEGLC